MQRQTLSGKRNETLSFSNLKTRTNVSNTEGPIASIKSNYNTNFICLRQEKFKPKI